MPKQTNHPFIPSFSKELDIESIISAPLVAVSKANAVMVSGQTRFLLEYCFAKTSESSYKPVLIEMLMTKGVIDESKKPSDADYIKQVQMSFTIPLLCLIPINSLVVDKVTIGFNMEVTSAISQQTGTANSTHNKVIDKKVQLNGKVGYDPAQDSSNKNQYRSRQSNKINVNLNAGTLPLPVGVLTILDLYTKAIQPVAVSDSPSNKHEQKN